MIIRRARGPTSPPSLFQPRPRYRLVFPVEFCRHHRRRSHARLPGRGRRPWVVSPPLPGRSGPLPLVDESRPHPRPLYRPWLAPPLRRLLSRLGEAWPSLSKVAVVRLPLRRAFPRWRRSSRACRRRLMSGKLSLPSGKVFSQEAERRGLARLAADGTNLSRTKLPRPRY